MTSPDGTQCAPEATLLALRLQGHACRHLGSPVNGDILERAAADLEAGGPVTALLAPWAEADARRQTTDAVPLRLLAALHELALSGASPDLAAAYMRQLVSPEPQVMWEAARAAMVEHRHRMAAFMGHEPQTNEVRRSICLLGGFLEIAKATGLPMRAFEIAASAGLNSAWDKYRYRLGDAVWGDPAAPVALDTQWSGPLPPLDAPIEVVERAACDRRPTDLSDLDQRRRLLSYVWADQLERLARIRAAIGVAQAQGLTVEAADALDWAAVHAAPRPGAVTVLFHSVFWVYMSPEAQAKLTDIIRGLGAAATKDAPFAWLRMEQPPDNLAAMEVRLTLWPGGEERLLADVHPHGATVAWKG